MRSLTIPAIHTVSFCNAIARMDTQGLYNLFIIGFEARLMTVLEYLPIYIRCKNISKFIFRYKQELIFKKAQTGSKN